MMFYTKLYTKDAYDCISRIIERLPTDLAREGICHHYVKDDNEIIVSIDGRSHNTNDREITIKKIIEFFKDCHKNTNDFEEAFALASIFDDLPLPKEFTDDKIKNFVGTPLTPFQVILKKEIYNKIIDDLLAGSKTPHQFYDEAMMLKLCFEDVFGKEQKLMQTEADEKIY